MVMVDYGIRFPDPPNAAMLRRIIEAAGGR